MRVRPVGIEPVRIGELGRIAVRRRPDGDDTRVLPDRQRRRARPRASPGARSSGGVDRSAGTPRAPAGSVEGSARRRSSSGWSRRRMTAELQMKFDVVSCPAATSWAMIGKSSERSSRLPSSSSAWTRSERRSSRRSASRSSTRARKYAWNSRSDRATRSRCSSSRTSAIPRDEVVRPPLQQVTVGRLDPEEVGKHGERQWNGELRGELDLARLGEGVDELVHARPHDRLHRPDPARAGTPARRAGDAACARVDPT